MNRLLTYTNDQEFTCNSFFLVDDSNNALLVDPGDRSDKFFDFIDKNGLNVVAVLLTHTHYDHIAGLPKIIDKMNPIIYVTQEDFEAKLSYVEDLIGTGALSLSDLAETIKSQQFEINHLKKENNLLKSKILKAHEQGFII